VLAILVLALAGCDLPSSSPNFKTQTRLSSPVVSEKTFQFLGSPASENEPLVDTTTASFDSLFAVGPAEDGAVSGQVFLEQEVTDFDIGEVSGALNEAADDLELDTTIAKKLVPGDDIADQGIDASYRTTNGVYESPAAGGGDATTVPLTRSGEVRVPFPDGPLLQVPTFEVVDASGARVESVTLTGEETAGGREVNRIDFTLSNDGSNTLTDGSGNAPRVGLVREGESTPFATARFGSTIQPGETERVGLYVGTQTIGQKTEIYLDVSGPSASDPADLTTSSTPLRYRQSTLESVSSVSLDGSQSDLGTRSDASSRFVGIIAKGGSLSLSVTNTHSFPIVLDEVRAVNTSEALAPIPQENFPEVVFEAADVEVPAGETRSVDLPTDGTGIAGRVNVALKASLPSSVDRAVVRASDGLEVSVGGQARIDVLHLRPRGEVVRARGTFEFSQDEVRFEEGDFIEFRTGTIAVEDLKNQFGATFETFTISYADVRTPQYASADSLVLRFEGSSSDPSSYNYPALTIDTDGRDIEGPLDDVRVLPVGSAVEYRLRGVLETTDEVRTLRADDEIRATAALRETNIRDIAGRFRPFSVNVTPNPDGDDRLEIDRDGEVQIATFDGLESLADRVDGLELVGSEFTISLTTNLGADARVYTALRGQSRGGATTYLRGENEKSAAPADSLTRDFVASGSALSADRLLQLGVEKTPPGETATQTLRLNESNSNVDAFISALPTKARLAAQALVGSAPRFDGRLQTPLTFDAGLNVSVPLRVRDRFVLRDTIDGDFSSLSDLTDPDADVRLDRARLLVDYGNGLPVGLDVRLRIVDGTGKNVLDLPTDEASALRAEPAPKTDAGTAREVREGTFTFDLSESEVRKLSEGEAVRLRVQVDQQEQGGLARLRARDNVRFTVRTDLQGTVTIE
jgi:hypothetical protein